MDEALTAALEERRSQSLYRSRRISAGPQGATVNVDGCELVNFCSNDYLGLANHPEVMSAFKQGAEKYGVGSGASHLINGHSSAHHALEEELADFVGRPRALLFSTGYMANLGVLSALVGVGDVVMQDRLNHASLIDAGLLSGARCQRYLHADTGSLQKYCSRFEGKYGRRLIVTDGVFSMDGDIAPLPELAGIAQQQDAWLMVDDAHGLGVLGDSGRGTVNHFQLNNEQVPILMGTLGKAFGTFGAFVAGSEALIETLIQQARSYIYTTALPPAVAVATSVSLRLLQSEDWRRDKLNDLVKRFRAGASELGLNLMESSTPVQPVLLGNVEKTLMVSEALYQQGLFVSAIRPPTVPEGSARLRITFSASHTEEQVDQLLSALDSMPEITIR
ncbi:MAG: 8-amino-7-oxononanoate synthase [Gammaproteobacteria bacterium]